MRRRLALAVVLALGAALLPSTPTSAHGLPRLEARIAQAATPFTQNPNGPNKAIYLGYTMNTRVVAEGDEVHTLPRDIVSNTAEIPRSALGHDEFHPAGLGVIAGGLSPYPDDGLADSYYSWSGFTEGTQVTDGDDTAHIRYWGSEWYPYEAPHMPTGRSGTLTWKHDPQWSSVVRGTTTFRSFATLPDGTSVRSPVPASFTRSMYLSHAELFATGGDIDASEADVPAPAFEFSMPAQPGTAMNVMLVSWTHAGPWKDKVTVTPNFNLGRVTGATGTWRLPVAATIKKTAFLPERVDSPLTPSPQHVVPVSAIAIPAAPESAGPGANEVHLVANVSPGQNITSLLAMRRPDGSIHTVKLQLAQPGMHAWRVEDGRLVEETPPGEDTLLAAAPDAEPRALGSGSEEGAPDTQAVEEPPPDQTHLEVNAEGRPVGRDVVRGGTTVFDEFDVARLLTPEGPIALGEHNRLGRAVIFRSSGEGEAIATAAYRAGGIFVLVTMLLQGRWFRTYVESHSADGEPRPHTVEGVTDLSAGTQLHDLMSGPVNRTVRLLPGELGTRILVRAGGEQFPLGPVSSGPMETILRNAGTPPRGEPLTDPELITRTEGPAVWDALVDWPMYALSQPLTPPEIGTFTAVKVYRVPPSIRANTPVPLGQPEETRDLDGTDAFAVAFRASRADGTPILQSQVKSLDLVLTALDGTELIATRVTPAFSPDGGTTWGVSLTPLRELDPWEVVIYARATVDGEMVTTEGSPALPRADWTFRIDRTPLQVAPWTGQTSRVSGDTEPLAQVTVSIPELGLEERTEADETGAFSVEFDLGSVPGGDYEAVVHAATPVPGEPDGTISDLVVVSNGDRVPDDEEATASTRIRWVPGSTVASTHGGGPVNRHAAISFLLGREEGGAFDSGLRPTSWAVRGLRAAGAEAPQATAEYLRGLVGDGGFAWRAGEAPSATATGLAATALDELGHHVGLDPSAFLRWDGGASGGSDASSVEATAQLLLALQASGELAAFDPWWGRKVADYLATAPASTPTEQYYATLGSRLVDGPGARSITLNGLDSVAYDVLLGADRAAEIGTFQKASGGFTLNSDGASAEAFPTGLALAASP